MSPFLLLFFFCPSLPLPPSLLSSPSLLFNLARSPSFDFSISTNCAIICVKSFRHFLLSPLLLVEKLRHSKRQIWISAKARPIYASGTLYRNASRLARLVRIRVGSQNRYLASKVVRDLRHRLSASCFCSFLSFFLSSPHSPLCPPRSPSDRLTTKVAMPFDFFTRRPSTVSESSSQDVKKASSLDDGHSPIVDTLTGTTDEMGELEHKGLGRHLGLYVSFLLLLPYLSQHT